MIVGNKHLIVHEITTLFSSSPLSTSTVLANEPGPEIRRTNYLPPTMIMMITSTAARLPWKESPRPSRPPSVSPSEGSIATPSDGSSMSEGSVEIQYKATPTDWFSTSEGPGGVQSKDTPSNGSLMSVSAR